MDHKAFHANGLPGDSKPFNAHDGNPLSEVPQLDHESSTIPSSSPSTADLGSAAFPTTLNPQAPWFDFSSPPALPGGPFPDTYVLPSFEQNFQNPITNNDDIKWVLTGMMFRLDALELAISTANLHISQVQEGVAEILRQSQSTEDIAQAIEGLKKSLKELVTSLVLHLLGGDGTEDVEM
ncbi:hypothetical protein CDD83_2209 [Cordyceps sp. RAO-2017]|nr:hypothetical protein CDD83_2209 [Cordyceps sp. RAO-2017]